MARDRFRYRGHSPIAHLPQCLFATDARMGTPRSQATQRTSAFVGSSDRAYLPLLRIFENGSN